MGWIPYAIMGGKAIFSAISNKHKLNAQKKAYYNDPHWALRKALIDAFYGQHADFREKYPGLYETLTKVPDFQMPSKLSRIANALGPALGAAGKHYAASHPQGTADEGAGFDFGGGGGLGGADPGGSAGDFSVPTAGAAGKPDCIGRPQSDPEYNTSPCLPQVLG